MATQLAVDAPVRFSAMFDPNTAWYRQRYGDTQPYLVAAVAGSEPDQVILKTAKGELLHTPEGQVARFPVAWIVSA